MALESLAVGTVVDGEGVEREVMVQETIAVGVNAYPGPGERANVFRETRQPVHLIDGKWEILSTMPLKVARCLDGSSSPRESVAA